MPSSMTAFARLEDTCEQGHLSWELRSVNHRYLDLNFRLPEAARGLEPRLRKHLQTKLARGKVDCVLRHQPTDNQSAAFDLNAPLLKSLLRQIANVHSKLPQHTAPRALEVLAWPGMLQTAPTCLQHLHAACYQLFKQATHELVSMRVAEGQRIERMLRQRCADIKAIVQTIRSRQPQVLIAIRDKLQQCIAQLHLEADQNRLEQELVYLAQKLDVAEELDRLDSHLNEMNCIFTRQQPTGRRLDFLAQEFYREANTLASKSADIETTQAAIDLKVLIEQMREQVQNVE